MLEHLLDTPSKASEDTVTHRLSDVFLSLRRAI
jgi:hypothetical protein